LAVKFLTLCTFGYNGAMSDTFRLWLSQEIDRRGWSHRELARQTGLSQTFVSKTLAGERKPSVNLCNKVAQAFDVSPETVLRLAGILPPAAPASPEDNQILQELVEFARTLPAEQQQQILEYARFIAQNRSGE
jgi:transcriptional regulator with XRE-family HTH domain